MLNDDDEEVRLATVRILVHLMPTFASASVTDITFVWSYLSSHMKVKTKQSD
ncbi:hypothetical protein HDU96_010460 [Phlyctochytrium bullatum]|nr:hypothetical protein HDU96_010460 [Phlyctochytrium bullatum]